MRRLGEDASAAVLPQIEFATPDITESDVDAVARVLRSGWLTTGEECAALEEELARFLGVPHVISVSSCTTAMELVFAYLDLPRGARVGVPTWTFVASALAPTRAGAIPVLLDVDPTTLNLSPVALEAALEVGLDALVAVHFAGLPVAGKVHELCSQAGIPIIEDAAHAMGASDARGRLNGTGSVAACFSFHATKNLSAAEGGAISTTSRAVADSARSGRMQGLSLDSWQRHQDARETSYDVLRPGLKANLPDVLAALARSQLARFPITQKRRRTLLDRYRANLSNISDLKLVPPINSAGSADHLAVIILPPNVSRRSVVEKLHAAGIASSIHFPPLHKMTWFRSHAIVGPAGTAVADALAPRALSLPLHQDLCVSDIDRVCDVLGVAVGQ